MELQSFARVCVFKLQPLVLPGHLFRVLTNATIVLRHQILSGRSCVDSSSRAVSGPRPRLLRHSHFNLEAFYSLWQIVSIYSAIGPVHLQLFKI